MSTSTRATILAAMKSALEAITTANGFQSDVALVLRGIHTEDEFSGRMPGLCFWNESGPQRTRRSEKSERTLIIHVWGYTKVDGINGDYEALDKLAADVEKVLMTSGHYTYWNCTEIKDNRYYEGGAADPIGIFEMLVETVYDYALAAP